MNVGVVITASSTAASSSGGTRSRSNPQAPPTNATANPTSWICTSVPSKVPIARAQTPDPKAVNLIERLDRGKGERGNDEGSGDGEHGVRRQRGESDLGAPP